jgi:hypothetical protein
VLLWVACLLWLLEVVVGRPVAPFCVARAAWVVVGAVWLGEVEFLRGHFWWVS